MRQIALDEIEEIAEEDAISPQIGKPKGTERILLTTKSTLKRHHNTEFSARDKRSDKSIYGIQNP